MYYLIWDITGAVIGDVSTILTDFGLTGLKLKRLGFDEDEETGNLLDDNFFVKSFSRKLFLDDDELTSVDGEFSRL